MSELAAIEGGGLRVSFRRLADRYAHRIEWMSGDSVCYALESQEGNADEVWPESPPLQELHFERREPGTQLALLVGRAGASHWSVSIEIDAAAVKIAFDVACRVRSAPGRVGSRYRPQSFEIESFWDPSIGRGSTVRMPGGFQVQSEPLPDRQACMIGWRSSDLRLLPSLPAAAYPQTLRWKYSIRRVVAADVR